MDVHRPIASSPDPVTGSGPASTIGFTMLMVAGMAGFAVFNIALYLDAAG